MPSKLTRMCFAAILATAGLACGGLLACAGSPAQADGMPDTGTKNFVPGGDAPAYLVNENLAVAPGSAGQSPLGTAYNEPTRRLSEPVSAERPAQTRTIRHGRRAARRSGIHRSTAKVKGRSIRAARTRTVRERKSIALSRSARKSRFTHKATATRRTGEARHAQARARHVAVKSASRRG